MSISKGSMNHIGTTPFKYKVDVFISYVDTVKTAGEVCVTWERRGKSEATTPVKVKDKKAIFRETLTMETTLFRKAAPGAKAGAAPAEGEELKFDEKVAKFALRKGNADGKAIGKMHINLADHIKGTTGTVFADLKLSNGSIVVTKIEANLLHMGKKKKNGSNAGSEMTDMTDVDGGMEDDSIFGDDTIDHGDLDIMIDEAATAGEEEEAPSKSPPSRSSPPATPSSTKSSKTELGEESLASKQSLRPGAKEKSKGDDGTGLAQSQSIRDKMKSKLKKDKDGKSKKEDGSSRKKDTSKANSAEISELKAALTTAQNENAKLKSSKQAMLQEIDELRSELESSETALEEAQAELGNCDVTSKGSRSPAPSSKTLLEENKDLREQVRDLEGQVEGLLEELDGESEDQNDVSRTEDGTADKKKYQRKIEDLEVALKREPQYLDVVDELKVTKMALALANMEKEQAIFALKQYESSKQSRGKDSAHSPVSAAGDSPSHSDASNSGWF